jgi:hypothetical protein
MKVKFRHAVKAFHGKFKAEGLVYCKYNDGALYLTRKYPHYTPSDQNHKIGNAGKNLGNLFKQFSEEYKNDLKIYSKLLVNYTDLSEKIPASYYNVYTKMMWALKRQIPEIDLSTITKDDIMKHEYHVRTVLEAMKAGLLLKIPEANILEHKM